MASSRLSLVLILVGALVCITNNNGYVNAQLTIGLMVTLLWYVEKAQIAQTMLTSTALGNVHRLIPNGDMSAVATWADDVRHTSQYHWSGV
jgi:hypothetical protein